MQSDVRQQLFDYAALGREIESFWGSSVGTYLLKRADDEYVKAISELETCDPTDFKAIVKCQGETWRAKSFRKWLTEGIEAGRVAENVLEERDDDGHENG